MILKAPPFGRRFFHKFFSLALFAFGEKLPPAEHKKKQGENRPKKAFINTPRNKRAQKYSRYSEKHRNKGASPFDVAVFEVDKNRSRGGGDKKYKVYALGGELVDAGESGEIEEQYPPAADAHGAEGARQKAHEHINEIHPATCPQRILSAEKTMNAPKILRRVTDFMFLKRSEPAIPPTIPAGMKPSASPNSSRPEER